MPEGEIKQEPTADKPKLSPIIGDSSEQPKNLERKGELIGKALGEFDGFIDDTKRIRNSESEFVEWGRFSVGRVAREAQNGNPKEIGFRNVQSMAEKLTHRVRAHLLAIENEAGKLGANHLLLRGEIEGLLKKIAQESNHEQALKLAQEAIERFRQTAQQIQLSREETIRSRSAIGNTVEENRDQAGRELRRAESTLNQSFEGTLLDRYRRLSFGLADATRESLGKMTSKGQEFEKTANVHLTTFTRIVQELAKNL